MKKYKNYNVIENYRDGFEEEALNEKMTDYFEPFDYIVGDWSYGKLRLKGFCKKENERYSKINDYELKDDYIKNSCAFNCRYFVLEKID